MSHESADASINSPIQDYLQELHARHANLRDGNVATYIPELAKANPDWFGICLVTTEGHVYEVGDSRQPFTIQSISKPFVYGLAIKDNTRAEVVVHEVMSSLADLKAVIFDFKHVLTINESASRLFYQLLLKLHEQGKPAVFTRITRVPQLRRFMKLKLKEKFDRLFLAFDDNDNALERCENQLLAEKIPVRILDQSVWPAGYELFTDLSRDEIAAVQPLLTRRKYERGDTIVHFGAPAGELFFLARGCASATLPRGSGTTTRLGTFSPGMAFGEMAMLDRAPRSAEVTADTDVECDLLKVEDFERFSESHPHIKLVLLRNLALLLSRNLRKRNQEFSVFDY